MTNKPLILAIDDDENVIKLIKANLTIEGFEVLTASNGQDGIKQFEDSNPSLILLDVMMPVMDGLETIRHIRKTSNVPIVMLTAKDDMRTLEQALSLGADDFITKPFSLRELTARVKSKVRRTKP
ncbi:MAG: response regulator [Dehalococcoidales bacterium]|nr:response regulator [Dehalococcoidales bacterium]